MGRGVSTIVLVVMLAGLGAYIYFVDSKRPGGVPGPAGTIVGSKEKVFAIEADKIEEVRVTAEKETSLLRKVDGTWQLIEPVQSAADDIEVRGLTSNITGLEYGRIVEENAADLANYGLADPRITVAFKGQDGVAGEIHIGERTATETDVYAVKAAEKRVFLLPSYHENSFNKKPFDLRDKRAVLVKRDEVDSVQVSGDANLQVARTGTEWRLNQPVQARADYSAVEGLITRVSSANMSKIVEQAPAGGALPADVLATYGLDKPAITVTIGGSSEKATLALSREQNGEVYARDLSRPMVFTVDSTLVSDLTKPADEYRNKNVFEFRMFNLARLRITRGANTYELQKTAASAPNEADKWQLATNGGAAAEIDTAKVEDLLSRLTNLRVESFAPAAASQPELTVSASYDDDGKFERVRFGKAGADVVASREGEPGGGRIDTDNYEETIKALDAVVAPPAS
jgi:hypothetical protein